MVQTGPCLGDGRGVAQHADGTLHLGEVAARNHSRWLVVDANLEASGAPVDKLDGPLAFNCSDGGVDVLGYNISTVQHAAGHVLAMTGIALHHLVGWFETGVCEFCNS